MAILQTKKQTDLEKRLKLLRQQVYGKNTGVSLNQYIGGSDKTNTPIYKYTDLPSADISYLYKDLTKILILATLAIAFQVILFILTQRHLVTLGF